jgi:hypothetical protein
MANIGRELITEFNRVSLPVYVIRDEMPDSLLSNLETNGIRSLTDGLVVPRGRPKYVKGKLSTLHPKDWANTWA